MKKQLQLLLLLLSVSYVFLVGCKKEDMQQRRTTAFTLIFTEEPKPLSFMGFFASSGGVTANGTCTMDVTPVTPQDSIHCTQTLTVPDEGTITILSQCSLVNNTGAWQISETTGSYTNLHGSGTLTMSATGNGPVELMKGQTWRN